MPKAGSPGEYEALYDRSFDIRWEFLDEGNYRPAMAVGLRDFVGTGVYSWNISSRRRASGRAARHRRPSAGAGSVPRAGFRAGACAAELRLQLDRRQVHPGMWFKRRHRAFLRPVLSAKFNKPDASCGIFLRRLCQGNRTRRVQPPHLGQRRGRLPFQRHHERAALLSLRLRRSASSSCAGSTRTSRPSARGFERAAAGEAAPRARRRSRGWSGAWTVKIPPRAR